MVEYKISSKSIFEHLWILLAGIVVFGAMLLYQSYESADVNWSLILGIYSIIYVTFVFIPIIVLFLSYYKKNQGAKVVVKGASFRFFSKKEVIDFSMEDIKEVLQVMTPNQAYSRTHFLPWEDYNYTAITLKDGRVLTITSLLVSRLKLPINKGRLKIKITFLPNFR